MADEQANRSVQLSPELHSELALEHVAHRRGRLKIFLGMAAGVGKTYTMLSEAQRRCSRGEDVVIGYLEPHDRPETTEMAAGLEVVPPKKIDYRGIGFSEMDTAEVLRRHPQWALVDELAHTNVPGTEHPKRWQSVEELLAAGINVITTVNIQHLESLNDAVERITGVRVRETFPDRLITEADEVVVVDLTPEALINRLQRGVVYDMEKVDRALVSFFTPDRLAALRELALRQTADEVDDQILAALGEASEIGWAGREVVVVCVTAREESVRLVRRGFRLAERLHAELNVLYVVASGHRASVEEQRALDYIAETARNLGALVDRVTGDDIASEIVDFAVARRATFLVLGQSVRTRFEEIVRGSIVTRVMRETAGMDVVIVSDREEGKGPARRRR